MIEIIQRTVAPESWSLPNVAINEIGNAVVVTHTAEVHARIAALLNDLARQRRRLVTLRLHRLTAAPPGNGDVLDAAGWSALGAQIPAVALVLREGEAGYHFSGVQRNHLADEHVEHGIHRPLVAALATGTILEALPMPIANGVRVRLHLNLSSAPTWTPAALRDDHEQPLFTLLRPEIRRDQISTTRLIPTGGATLFRFGERIYALTADVVDPEQSGAPAHP